MALVEDYINAVYVGAPGSGKTTAALGLARMGKVAFFDFEAGVSNRVLKINGIDPANVKRVPGPMDIETLWAALDQIEAKGDEYVGVVFDSATEWQAGVLAALKRKNPGLVKGDNASELYIAWTEIAKAVYRRVRDMPLHSAFVTLPKRVVDESGVYYRPELSPAIADFYTSQANTVVATTVKENPHAEFGFDYLGILNTIGVLRGKDRLRLVAGGVLANPSLDRLVRLVSDDLDLDVDQATVALRKRLADA